MDKLLVIGAGIGQVPIVKKAKSRGINVTVATMPGKQPCIDLADDVIYSDIYERDFIVEEAKKRKITAVISDQNDLMNPTVAYVAEKLGLPGNKFDTIMSYCNKNLFRDNCEKAGVPVPKHIAVNSKNFDFSSFDCPFPWIVKPADSQSSVGVKKIENKEELFPALKEALAHSKTHSAIIEEFFVGTEFVAEGFINDGKYYLLNFADRKYFALNGLLIPNQTLFPSTLNQEILDKVVQYETQMAKYTNPSFAIVHSEYLVNPETREIRVVETALRGGGVYISSHLIPLSTGIDINDVLLSKALGNDVDIDSIFENRNDKAAAYVCFYLPEGEVVSVDGIDQIKNLSFVKMVCLDNIVLGQKTEKMLHKGLRKGPILVTGKDRIDLEKNILTIQEILKIKVLGSDTIVRDINWI